MEKSSIPWSEEAEKALEKVPDFVRPMAKEMIEAFATDSGAKEVTAEIMTEARAKFGM